MNPEVLQIVTNWFARTELVLKREINRRKIRDTGDLESSLRQEVHRRSADLISGEVEFLLYGRFLDMGAGKNSKVFQTREGNRALTGGQRRRAKNWYSKTFWGRINDLQGVLGYQLMEEALQSVKDPLDTVG